MFGGTLHASPLTTFVTLPTDMLGRFGVSLRWPTLPVGTTTYPQAAFGVTLSNGLRSVSQ